jgi:hypothetical protein
MVAHDKFLVLEDVEFVNELLRFTKTKTKTAAVAETVKEQIMREKLKELAGLLGSIDY